MPGLSLFQYLILERRLGRVLTRDAILFVLEKRVQLLIGRDRPIGIVRKNAPDYLVRTGKKINARGKDYYYDYPCPNAQVRFVFILDSLAVHAAGLYSRAILQEKFAGRENFIWDDFSTCPGAESPRPPRPIWPMARGKHALLQRLSLSAAGSGLENRGRYWP